MLSFLQPILSQWGSPSPLTIGINALVTPVVGVVLFPVSLVCFFLPSLTWVGDGLWRFLFYLAENLSTDLALWEARDFFGGRLWIWLYALVVNFVLIGWEIHRDKKV